MMTLEYFADRVLHENPFLVNRVLQPSTADADAAAVHQAEFRRLVELAELARRQRLGVGAVLWGEAGVGKSHLLARLARWAEEDHRAFFVYFHNLQARADTLPRYVVNCVVSTLTGGRTDRFHQTTLFWLVNAALKSALGRYQGSRPTWKQVAAAYDRLVHHLIESDPARAALIDRGIYEVLFRFFRSAYMAYRAGVDDGVARLAALWLAGESLGAGDARRLGLTPADGDAALRDEQHLKQVLIALAQMALSYGRPLLFGFDQVDNLEADQIGALCRFVQALLDTSPNLLVVMSGVQSALLRFREDRVIQDSAWDRLAQFEISLQRISPQEAGEIARARLEPFLQPFQELEPVQSRVARDPLFPLGAAWFEEFLQGKPAVRPRDVITWACEGWRREQEALRRQGVVAWLDAWGSPRPDRTPTIEVSEPDLEQLIDRKVDQKIAEHQAQREAAPQTLPPDAGNLAGLLNTLLQQCLTSEQPYALQGVQQFLPKTGGQRPIYDLMIRQRDPAGHERRAGVVVAVTTHATSVAALLRRLVFDVDPPERVRVIVDARRPLRFGNQGRHYLEQLRRRGPTAFRKVTLSFRQYAYLDALEAVVRMARSRDLEVEAQPGRARPVTEREVIASHHRRRRYLQFPTLCELLLGESAGGAADAPAAPAPAAGLPDERDGREFILAQLSLTPGESSQELAARYADYLKTTKKVRLDLPTCRNRVEEIARKLHQEGRIRASTRGDGLFLHLVK